MNKKTATIIVTIVLMVLTTGIAMAASPPPVTTPTTSLSNTSSTTKAPTQSPIATPSATQSNTPNTTPSVSPTPTPTQTPALPTIKRKDDAEGDLTDDAIRQDSRILNNANNKKFLTDWKSHYSVDQVKDPNFWDYIGLNSDPGHCATRS